MRVRLVLGMVAVGLLAVAAPATAQQAQQKFAYLDSRRILQEAPGAQEARTAIEQEMRSFQQRLESLQDSLQKVIEDYQSRSLTLAPDVRRSEEQRIAAKQRELEAQAEQLRLDANRKQNDLMQPVMDRVEQAIETVRKEGGYAMVFDAASGAFVSADTTLDLTTQVINRLKAGGSSSSPNSSAPRN
jgi:outer membrane protein